MYFLKTLSIFLFSFSSFAADYFCEGKHSVSKKDYIIKLQVNEKAISIKSFFEGIEVQECKGSARFNLKKQNSIVKSHHIYWDIKCSEYQKSSLIFHEKGDLKIYEDQTKPDSAFFLKNEQPINCKTMVNKSKFITELRKILE